ncbi:M48 family metalloprotease [Nonomuraea salmonea]|uniref:M48 family metalloprotease n=1 Tax=Nonomuraea salmonea TaxID=46181 RepID=UPI0031E8C80E
MQQGALRTNLLDLAARDGVPVEDVLVADASRRTTALNAYVSGFGATRRIVVYDTLLRAPQREVELVVAHELGHAKYDDVLHGTLIGALGSAFGAILLYLVFDPAAAADEGHLDHRSAGGRRAAGADDDRRVPAGPGPEPDQPAHRGQGRRARAGPDAGSGHVHRHAKKRLATTNISDLTPNAVEYVLYASHPSSPERIAMARTWARLNGVPIP